MRMRVWAGVCVLGLLGAIGVQAQSETAGANAAPSPSVAASVLRLIKFSGNAADAQGRPLHGTVGVTFALYAGQQGGTPLWLETQNVALDGQGHYTALLGATQNGGLPLEIFASGEARWLGIRLQGQPEQPRVLLVAVPYALKAAEAETLSGKKASDFVTTEQLPEQVQKVVEEQKTDSTTTASETTTTSGGKAVVSSGATNFTDTTTDQVVKVTQNGTGYALLAVGKGSNGVFGATQAANANVYGLFGQTIGEKGGALIGFANSTTGTAVGVQGVSKSATGTAGAFVNTAGGTVLLGRGAGNAQVFSVDGSGNVTATAYFGDGSNLTGIGGGGGGGDADTLDGLDSTDFAQLAAANTFTDDQTMNANLALPNTTTGAEGVITKNGERFLHDFGTNNTFVGLDAGNFTMTGSSNSGFGHFTMALNSTGNFNTAFGSGALFSNQTGINNTAVGSSALSSNKASGNTAVGSSALLDNENGFNLTAVGQGALQNTTASNNTAVGTGAMQGNTTGQLNAALGAHALDANISGNSNTAIGQNALGDNTIGAGSTAVGSGALLHSTGSFNIGIGLNAGIDATTGDNNIYIDNAGMAAEGATIRIGDGDQTRAFISGIRGVTTDNANAIAVLIDSNGQLGTVSSSQRFKEDIREMGESSVGLHQLRPVVFRYRKPFANGAKPLQYGLIAEEVAEVYPELVAYNEDGQPETVLYRFLAPMLLNEVQHQEADLARLRDLAAAQATELAAVKAQLAKDEALLEQVRAALEAQSRVEVASARQ